MVKLPQAFRLKLEENTELDGIVKMAMFSFGEVLRENRLYFFEEYTDHGINHIESILAASENLITTDTHHGILKSKDVSFYILAVLLHDIGMHLNLEGFNRLISGDFDNFRIPALDKLTWRQLWEEYLNEAKRFSQKQLIETFGDDSLIIDNPNLEPGKINGNDRKLIGEFIRRHHPRLAHEIALYCFPGTKNIEFAPSLNDKERYLIGFIARSHGMDLRASVDHIESLYSKNNRRYPHNVHAVFLMVVLRIADYIQIDNTRTSSTLLKLKTFSSPISQLEHQSHLAIESIDGQFQDDPERIYVATSPRDSFMYLKLQKLIRGIQNELDVSWAVLGELYGTISAKANIKYRRIKANLEEKEFAAEQAYVPDQFAFKANDELIKLLISPLYGDDPSYGVRELLQNAIDACNERERIEIGNGNESYSPKITVKIYKENNSHFFIIQDNGYGMNIHVIKDYFLSAGASFRQSAEWQKAFIDQNGQSRVQRSGRFGVGALASFLIGKEVSVETRSINAATGYKFTTNINTSQIDVIKDATLEIGTRIKILVTETTLKKLSPKRYYQNKEVPWYRWFTLDRPIVEYSYLGNEIPKNRTNPDLKAKLPRSWNSLDSKGFNKILWTYSSNYNSANFTCNGIVIPLYNDPNQFGTKLYFKLPKISVFDNDAYLPLNLNRNSLTSRLPFAADLETDIYKDLIAYLLTHESGTKFFPNQVLLRSQKLLYPGFGGAYPSLGYKYGEFAYRVGSNYNSVPYLMRTLLVNKDGFILDYNYFLKRLDTVNAIYIQSNKENELLVDLDVQNRFVKYSDDELTSIDDYKYVIEPQMNSRTNARIFMKQERYSYLFKSEKKRVSLWLNKLCKVVYNEDGWTGLHLDSPKPTIITKEFLQNNSKNIDLVREYEISCKEDGVVLLDKLLQRYIGEDVIIPHALEERKAKFPLAFLELESYMRKYQSKKK